MFRSVIGCGVSIKVLIVSKLVYLPWLCSVLKSAKFSHDQIISYLWCMLS